jgi:predicted enzyme related to lactoylglutathione lyase
MAMPGARLRWRFHAFAADVAAVDLGGAPLVLLADHRPAGSVLPIYAVADLDDATDAMVAGGRTVQVGPMGTPEGPATVLADAGGATVALLRVDRPGAMDDAYDDDANGHAVRAP